MGTDKSDMPPQDSSRSRLRMPDDSPLYILAIPNDSWARPLPAIVILPDWDGVNMYEQERATALADLGYFAMAADIYGSDNQNVESTQDRIALVTKYRTDPDLYVARIQDAIAQVKQVDGVDPEEDAAESVGVCPSVIEVWVDRLVLTR